MVRHRNRRVGAGAVLCGFVAIGIVIESGTAAGPPSLPDPPQALSAPDRREILDDPHLSPGTRRTSPPAQVAQSGFIGIQVNVDADGNNILGDAANEPSIAVDRADPTRMAIGWRQFDTTASNFRQAGWGYTRDQGFSWTFPGVIDPGVFRSDPVLESDADGTFYYYSLTNDPIFECELYRSFDGGETWDAGVYAYGGDKGWIAIDRTGGIGHGNIYAAWDHAGCCDDDWFNRSTTGGDSFEPPVPIPEEPIWGVVAVGPGGEVYVSGRRFSTSSAFIVARSTTIQDPAAPLAFDLVTEVDLGGSLVFGAGPNPGGLLGQAWLAVDHSNGPTNGNVYLLCSVNPPGPDPLDVHFSRSSDGGITWSAPVRVNNDPLDNGAWQWFGTMAVAPGGRIDVIWNDTRNDPGGVNSQLYYASSTDAGVTWTPSVSVSPSFDPHVGWPQQEKLGDYYDMVSDDVGAHVAWAATFNGEQDVYYLRIGDQDCNANGIPDPEDIAGGTSDDSNGNGIPDECELGFVRGDDNGDGSVDAADPIYGLDYLFLGGPSVCLDAQDSNDDGVLDIADPTYTLGYLFVMGSAPPAPFPYPNCGVDPTGDGLGCDGSPFCP